MTLPPDAAILEPLDTLAWTSERNGYSTKHFELGDMQDDLPTILQTVYLREVDPTDFNDPPEYGEVVTPVPTTRRPIPAQILAGFTAVPGTTLDAAGLPRRPHIVLIWDGDEQDGVAGIEWEVRLAASGVIVARGSTSNVEAGSLTIFDGILPNTLYQARARQIAVWPVAWTGWAEVNSTDVRLTANDLATEITTAINDAVADANAAASLAAAAQTELDALTVGFTGTLAGGFNSVNTALDAVEAQQVVFDAEVGDLNSKVTNILGTRADLLAGTSFAALLTQLGVSAAGASAWVTTQAAAVADLEGNASASYAFRVGAGGTSAGLELVAFYDASTGSPASNVKINGDWIDLVGRVRASDLLVSNSRNLFLDFDMVDTRFYQSDDGAVYSFIKTGAAGLGAQYLSIAANVAAASVYTKGWFSCEPSTEYLVKAAAWLATTVAGGGTVTVYVQEGSIDSAGVVTYLSQTVIKQTVDTAYNATTSWGEISLTTGSTTRRMRILIQRSAGGTQAGRAGGIWIEKKVGASLVVEGSITGYHIQTNSLDASVIGAGKLTAEFLDINQMVTITSDEAGFAFGKTSPGDFSTDGMFMGKSLTSGGASGFGFLLGKTSPGGFDQSIQHTTEGGLKITNANFQFNAGSGTSSEVTTSQTVTLPVGTKTIDLSILGGGGGGGAYNTTYTTKGGTTTVQLWNGTTNTGISWTAAGGLDGGSSSKVGQSSAYGTGGGGAYWVGSPSNGQLYASGVATGYASGGGGGGTGNNSDFGKGGAAGSTKTVTSYDVSGLANPKLVITLGAGGSTGAAYSSAGTKGIVKITTSAIVSVPANVVPLRPTASGSFSKAANATGSLVFPDLGAGLWILNTSASGLLYLDQVKISSDDKRIRAANARSVTFVADIRPNITVGNANAATIEYVFYSMKVVT